MNKKDGDKVFVFLFLKKGHVYILSPRPSISLEVHTLSALTDNIAGHPAFSWRGKLLLKCSLWGKKVRYIALTDESLGMLLRNYREKRFSLKKPQTD